MLTNMESILKEELRIKQKLQELEARKRLMQKQNKLIKLTEIDTPDDLGSLAEARRHEALSRNADFLQELEIETGKLHTKRLCPIDAKLEELKRKLLQ